MPPVSRSVARRAAQRNIAAGRRDTVRSSIPPIIAAPVFGASFVFTFSTPRPGVVRRGNVRRVPVAVTVRFAADGARLLRSHDRRRRSESHVNVKSRRLRGVRMPGAARPRPFRRNKMDEKRE